MQSSELEQAELRSASGAGAGAFLHPPTQEDHLMTDGHFVVAVRLRARAAVLPQQSEVCMHKDAETGRICGKECDTRGFHARTCKVGGGVVRRHDRIRDWLQGWVAMVTGTEALKEQYVPHWDSTDSYGNRVRARLDVCFVDQGRKVYVDVAVTESATTCSQTLRARAKRNAAAAIDMEDRKRIRYPGPALRPFVVEALGRCGPGALALLKSLAPTEPEERPVVLAAARQTLSVLVQTSNTELMLSASR